MTQHSADKLCNPTVRLVLQVVQKSSKRPNSAWRISQTFNFREDMTPAELAVEMEIVETRVNAALGRI